MSRIEIERAYPLRWPEGRPRTAARKPALFRQGGEQMTIEVASARLEDQLWMITPQGKPWRTRDIILTTNIRYTARGARDRNISRGDPADPGAALYFALDDRPYVLACDRWVTLADNIAAIAAHIDALRGQERWGVADLQQAFAGHIALPAPETWWQVLGVPATATRAEIDAAWRRLAPAAHPDVNGGSDAAMARLNVARDEGRMAAG